LEEQKAPKMKREKSKQPSFLPKANVVVPKQEERKIEESNMSVVSDQPSFLPKVQVPSFINGLANLQQPSDQPSFLP
jgi:hypothetical protein